MSIEDYESKMAAIYEELKNNSNISHAIEHVINDSDDLTEMQSKLILLVRKHVQDLPKRIDPITGKKIRLKDEQLIHDINEFSNKLIRKYEENDPDIGKMEDSDDEHPLNTKAKKAIKKAIKEFTIYEIYKVMNPRRIAGETKKDNYIHNAMMGGQKRAHKYEGGKKSDLKRYGSSEVSRIERASKSFQNHGGGFSL